MTTKAYVRKVIVYSLLVLLSCCLQVSFPDKLSLLSQTADLMFVLVVLCSYFYGLRDGAVLAIIVGLIRDYFSAPSVLGIDGNAVSTVGIGILVMFMGALFGSLFFTKRMNRNILFGLIGVVGATILYKFVGHIVIRIWITFFTDKIYNLTWDQAVLKSTFPQVLVNLATAIIYIPILRYLGPYKKGKNPRLMDEEERKSGLWLTV